MLSLTIMALLVLMVLTIAGFLNLESRLSSAALSHARARMNAVTAARLALGQLQQLAGHDQRVTARADLFDPEATGSSNNTYLKLAALNDQRRWWTGVWSTGGANGSKLRDWDPADPDKRLFAGWLVSPQGTGQVLGATVASNLTSTLSNDIVKQLEVASNGTRGRITLLGGESLPAGTTLAGGRVESDVATFPTSGGGYAWWTADEGIKARINLSDPLAAKGSSVASRVESMGVNDWWRGFSGVAVGRVGVELAGTNSGDTASLPNRPTAFLPGHQASREAAIDAAKSWTDNPILRAYSREELQAWLNSTARAELDPATKAASIAGLARGWHDLTTSSRGVLSNQLDGGLKVDLSVAFELPYDTVGSTKGWKDLTCFTASPDKNNLNLNAGVTTAAEPLSNEWNHNESLRYVFEIPIPDEEVRGRTMDDSRTVPGPTWDLLRAHYRLYKRELEPLTIPGVPWTVSADAWLARGSAPFTFQAGSKNQATHPTMRPHPGGTPSLPTTPPALYGAKANLAALQPLAAGGIAQPRHFRKITLEDGEQATRIRELRARLAPQVTRVGMIHSLIYCQNTLAIGLDPFLAVHNPYDVPLEFAGIGATWAQFNNARFNIYRADSPTTPIATCTLGNDAKQRSYTIRGFHTYTPPESPKGRWNYTPTDYLRLEPGETCILTPNLAGNRWQVYRAQSYQNISVAAFAYDLQSNFRINAHRLPDMAEMRENSAALDALVAPGAGGTGSEPLTVELALGDVGQVNAFDVHLYRANRYASSSSAPGWWAWLGDESIAIGSDHSDEHLLQRIGFRANQAIAPSESGGIIRSQPFTRSTAVDATRNLPDKRFFAITELRLRSTSEANGFPAPVLAFNPRAQLSDPRNWDGQSSASPAWQASARPLSGDPLTELQFWPGNVPEKNQASWGESHFPGSGTRTTVLFQVPRRPLLSLAQLTHADIGELDLDPVYAIGNSYAHPGLDSLDKVLHWPASTSVTGSPLERIDQSFAANKALWDRTFFSGFNYGTTKAPTTGTNPATGKTYDGTGQPYTTITAAVDALFTGATDVLANRRMTWSRFPKASTTATDALLKAEFVKPEQTAKQLVNEGAFNVNSTSVAAWKAQLASGFQALANGTSNIPDYPFGRMQPPTGESVDIAGSGNTNRWSTFRSLKESDGTLTKLAEAIVAEVRARGPFMSLSDFVNRRLVTDRNGQKGALQAAIDAVTPAINASVNATTIGPGSLSRIPQAAALSPGGTAAETPVALGRPDQLLQSDVLAALGPALAARSDTFVIRAYGSDGDSRGSAGQAWCEITVQRLPEWINPSAEDLNVPDSSYRASAASTRGATVDTLKRNTALSAVNKQLGRRFVIVSFRWVPSPTQ